MDAATQSMINNLPTNTGKSLDEWFTVLEKTGLSKHTELMNYLKTDHGVSHGFANSIVLFFRDRNTPSDDDALIAAQYSGAKAGLLPICEALMSAAQSLGSDVEIAPKRTGVSLRRTKQFALIEAPSAKRIQLGINLKDTPATERLLLAGGMCTHKVNLTTPGDIDDELLGWLQAAYEGS